MSSEVIGEEQKCCYKPARPRPTILPSQGDKSGVRAIKTQIYKPWPIRIAGIIRVPGIFNFDALESEAGGEAG